MSNPTVSYSFTSGTTITASEVNTNFSDLISWISGGNIDATHIAASAITATELASDAVTSVKILDSAVTTAKINDSAVTTAKIADLGVTSGKLASNAVTTAKITDSNVTTAKIADAAVTGAKIATSAALAGSPTTTTQTWNDDSTKIATTAFVQDARPVAKVHLSANQTITTIVQTKITLDTETFDTGGIVTVSAGDITVTEPGKYRVTCSSTYDATTSTGNRRQLSLYIDGARVVTDARSSTVESYNPTQVLTWIGELTDNQVLAMYQRNGSDGLTIQGGLNYTYMAIEYLGA